MSDDDIPPQPWRHICPVVRAELRKMWWRLRRRGVVLPAEKNVILIDGYEGE